MSWVCVLLGVLIVSPALGSGLLADDFGQRAFILAKLREHDWNVSETARAVDMPRSNLYKKIERYGLVREET